MPRVITTDSSGRDWRFTRVDMGSRAADKAKADELVAEVRQYSPGDTARIEWDEDEL